MTEICDMTEPEFKASVEATNKFLNRVFLLTVKKVEVNDE